MGDFEGTFVKLVGDVKVSDGKIFIKTYSEDILFYNKYTFRNFLIERYKKASSDFKYVNTGTAFLFGESRDILKPEVRANFLSTGLIHLLVISGLHIGMITLILSLLIPRPYGYILAIGGVIFYVLFIVYREPPVLRASIMFLLFVTSLLIYRKVSGISILLFSGTLILLIYPYFVSSYSFWLSLIATAYIILALRDFKGGLVKKSILVSLSAFTGTAPLIGNFSFVSPVSIILSPLIAPIVFVYSLLGVISIFTFFYLNPIVDLFNIVGFSFIKIVNLLGNFSFLLYPQLNPYESAFVVAFGAFLLYVIKTNIYKILVLLCINIFLTLNAVM